MSNNPMKRLKRMSVMNFGERISLITMAGKKKITSSIRIKRSKDPHQKETS